MIFRYSSAQRAFRDLQERGKQVDGVYLGRESHITDEEIAQAARTDPESATELYNLQRDHERRQYD